MTMEKFHYTTQAGVDITLPKFGNVKSGAVRKLRSSGEMEVIFGILEDMADARALAKIDEMPLPELGEMFKAWQEDTGVTVGESGASSTS